MKDLDFAGKIVLISGAAGGFGQLAARAFAARGASLALTDIAVDRMEAIAAELRGDGHRVASLAGDISLAATSRDLVALALREFGRLDIAINNAGIAHGPARLADIPAHLAERVIAVDLLGVFHAMQAQLPAMVAQGAGVILNVASAAGLVGAPLMAAYAAAKHGVVGLTRTASAEYARAGVRINALCPAFSETAMVADLLGDMRGTSDEARARLLSAIPLRRLASPDEIVAAMLWLCSAENSFMTGHCMALDGGLSAI